MRLVKGFLIVVTGFFVLITLISLLIPSTVVTVKSVSIHASQQKIVAAIQDLNQWQNWHPVFRQENKTIKVSQPSFGVDAKLQWLQNEKPHDITITKVFPEGIQFNLNSAGEKPVETFLSALPMQEPNTFQVEWKAVTKLKWYPWEKFGGIFITEMTGPGYEQALNSLKQYIENNQ
ncbi:MAG: hypothetical protein EOP53_19520 [Sphingobacteriales bacterium]|nr:MAG: hypothetical protein EOP53_19520 [Sphingobacteriales bacterium]